MSPSKRIWEFFLEYYDDSVVFGGGPAIVSARTMRVLGAMFGRPLLRQIVDAWKQDGDVAILGDWDELDGNEPALEVLDYVFEKEFDSSSA